MCIFHEILNRYLLSVIYWHENWIFSVGRLFSIGGLFILIWIVTARRLGAGVKVSVSSTLIAPGGGGLRAACTRQLHYFVTHTQKSGVHDQRVTVTESPIFADFRILANRTNNIRDLSRIPFIEINSFNRLSVSKLTRNIIMDIRAVVAQSVERVATLDGRGIGVRVPVGSRIFSFPYRPYRLWGPSSLLSNWYLRGGGGLQW
jgi:hypothetical protein